MRASMFAVVLALPSLLLLGCGGPPDCSTTAVLLIGSSATSADHLAKAPDNSVRFSASTTQQLVHPENACGVPALGVVVLPDWKVSDTVNVTISSAKDLTNGTATCKGATNGAVTVTASVTQSGAPLTATATLTCK